MPGRNSQPPTLHGGDINIRTVEEHTKIHGQRVDVAVQYAHVLKRAQIGQIAPESHELGIFLPTIALIRV